MADRSTIILIPGAWQSTFHYTKLVEGLQAAGHPVLCYTLPTNTHLTTTPKTYADDLQFVRYVAEKAINQGRTVDVVAHSYGGIVAAGALHGLGVKTRAKENKAGGLRYFLAFSSYLPLSGRTLPEVLEPLEFSNNMTVDEKGTSFPNDPEQALFHDLEDAEEKKWALDLLTRHSVYYPPNTPYFEDASWPEFEQIFYLKCMKDQAIVQADQDKIIKHYETKTGRKVTVTESNTGHSAQYFPETVEWILQAIN